MQSRSSRALAWMLTFAAGCGGSAATSDVREARSSLARDLHPAVTDADSAQLSDDNRAFAMALTTQAVTASPHANVFLSPYSVSLALAMTYAGARAATESEMASALRFTLPQERLHPAFDALDLALASRAEAAGANGGADGKGFRLRVTDSLWGSETTSFEAPFLDTLAVSYGAGVKVAPFATDPEGSRKTINAWASRETEGRIAELLGEGKITKATRFVLVNAIYFNAAWQTPFAASATADGPFTTDAGATTTAHFMTALHAYSYAESDTYQAVALPYEGGQTSMVVLLPRDRKLADVDAGLGATYADATSKLAPSQVSLELPRFTIEGASLSLVPALGALGMKLAFTEGADFSGITKSEPLLLADVVHQAFVKVDEAGTEAAAATAVIGEPTSVPVDPPKTMRVDRPFYVFVRDDVTRTVLFAGRVVAPAD